MARRGVKKRPFLNVEAPAAPRPKETKVITPVDNAIELLDVLNRFEKQLPKQASAIIPKVLQPLARKVALEKIEHEIDLDLQALAPPDGSQRTAGTPQLTYDQRQSELREVFSLIKKYVQVFNPRDLGQYKPGEGSRFEMFPDQLFPRINNLLAGLVRSMNPAELRKYAPQLEQIYTYMLGVSALKPPKVASRDCIALRQFTGNRIPANPFTATAPGEPERT